MRTLSIARLRIRIIIAGLPAAVSCKILEDRFSCPLNAGPVEVRLYKASDYKPQPLRQTRKGDVDNLC